MTKTDRLFQIIEKCTKPIPTTQRKKGWRCYNGNPQQPEEGVVKEKGRTWETENGHEAIRGDFPVYATREQAIAACYQIALARFLEKIKAIDECLEEECDIVD